MQIIPAKQYFEKIFALKAQNPGLLDTVTDLFINTEDAVIYNQVRANSL